MAAPNRNSSSVAPAAELTRDRRQTREKLLDAGLRLFAQKGFDGTPISDLERAAGLRSGTGSFYRHFSGKEELLHELVARETASYAELAEMHARTLSGSLGNARAELVLKLRVIMHMFEQKSDFIQILIREEDKLSEDARSVRRMLVEDSQQRDSRELQKMMEAGHVIRMDPHALWNVVTSALMGHFLAKRYFHVSTLAGVDEEHFINTLADLLTIRREA
ncbi:MAG: TetR/AcrR family transcriptional regulator [Gammaproteobacteria bacterium]|nr:TetR/AcrR family transcriptional regulator [Gammaproteobacteria bacterium]